MLTAVPQTGSSYYWVPLSSLGAPPASRLTRNENLFHHESSQGLLRMDLGHKKPGDEEEALTPHCLVFYTWCWLVSYGVGWGQKELRYWLRTQVKKCEIWGHADLSP